jgi:amidase
MSATAIARAIRDGACNAEETMEACLHRIEEVNSRLNAVVRFDASAARAAARAADAARVRGERLEPLHGVPVTVKDSLDVLGFVCAVGTKGRAGYLPERDATAVARLRAAGAIVIGKTNVPELCLTAETDNLLYGRTSNPYDTSRSAGGSSGGECGIVAAGGSPLGIGSDAGGSIRIPAHYCGVAGLRTTPRRVPRSGHFPAALGLFEPFVSIGPIARRVEDLSLALGVLAGPSPDDAAVPPVGLGEEAAVSALRVAFFTDNGIAAPTAETAEAVRAAAASIEGEVASVDEARPPGVEEAFGLYFAILTADGGAGLRALLETSGTIEPHPIVDRLLGPAGEGARSAAELGEMLVRADVLRQGASAFMESYDVVLSPVSAEPAPPYDAVREVGGITPAISYAAGATLFGWPAVVVRAGTSPEGLPIGVQVAARSWGERDALAVAERIEASLGGWRQPPL